MTSSRLNTVIVGAGGFGRELRWLISELHSGCTAYVFKGFVVTDFRFLPTASDDELILGTFDWLTNNRDIIGAIAVGIGDPKNRMQIGQRIEAEFGQCFELPSLIHRSCLADWTNCKLGLGTVICANAVLTTRVEIGRWALVNLACTIGHDVRIGDGTVLCPGAHISGGATIGNECFIGSGAVVFPNVVIGNNAKIGAGAVVKDDVEENLSVVGVPARPSL